MTITATYAGYPLLTLRPDWQGASLDALVTSSKSRLDNTVSSWVDDDLAQTPVGSRGARWTLTSRAEITAWRTFLGTRLGRLRAFWVPTWLADLTLTQEQLAAQNTLTLQYCAFTKYYAISDFGRRHLTLIFPGSPEIFVCRRVESAVDNGDGTETLTLDTAFGVDVPVGTMVSLLTLCRFDDDRVDLRWQSAESAIVEVTLTELPREAPTA